MKIQLLDIIKTGDIYPFRWNDSEKDILEIFPEWKLIINKSKEAKCPFILVDSVEFYFEKDHYKGLTEIVIKLWNFDDKYESKYFDIGWLKDDLNFKEVFNRLKKDNWNFILTKESNSETPLISASENVLFGFETLMDGNLDENKTELQKIYISKTKNDIELISGGNIKTVYNIL